jgi:hypothetical protein
MFRKVWMLSALGLAFGSCDSAAVPPNGNPVGAHEIDFTEPGAHVFAAEWLVFQPTLSGAVDSMTEVAAAPASWTTHPSVLEAQSLSQCGSALNQGESIRNLEAAGFPQPVAVANLRSLQVAESITGQTPVPFCAAVHGTNQMWTFWPTPVVPTADVGATQATGGSSLVADQADLVAILFDSDAVVTGVSYQTSP